VSYLQCGHLMHVACKAEYTAKGNYSCPVCSKSLGELAPVFKKLDHLLSGESMPSEYRTARCDLHCLDCSRPSAQQRFHFLYNKCPLCSSYNTRVERVDANAGAAD
jgi:zinc finger protein-like protein